MEGTRMLPATKASIPIYPRLLPRTSVFETLTHGPGAIQTTVWEGGRGTIQGRGGGNGATGNGQR